MILIMEIITLSIYLENNRIFYYFGIFNFTTIRTIYVSAKEENFLEKQSYLIP